MMIYDPATNSPIDDLSIQQAILIVGQAIVDAINAVGQKLGPQATKLVLQYSLEGGTKMGAPVSDAIVGQTYNPTVTESNPTVPSISPIGPLSYISTFPLVASVNPASGVVTILTEGTTTVTVLDSGNSLTDSVVFTIPAAVATSLDLGYAVAPPA